MDRIAAVVNEDVILRSELDRAVANIRAQYAGKEDQLPPPEVLERQVLERLILMRLQLARAKEAGITASDEEIENALNGVAQQNNMSVDQLRAAPRRGRHVVQRIPQQPGRRDHHPELRQSFAQGRINVSEAEVDAALATAAARPPAASSSTWRTSWSTRPTAPRPNRWPPAQKKIEGVKGLIDKGEMTFSAAAVRYSDSPNALEGGDLGWRGQNEIPPAFLASIQQMQPGQIIGPDPRPQRVPVAATGRNARCQAADAGEQVTQFQARQILVKVDDKTDDAAAKAKIETLRARIAGGADFAKLATENSDDVTTKRRGGDLGWLTGRYLRHRLTRMQVAALDDQGVSAPFKTDAGWVHPAAHRQPPDRRRQRRPARPGPRDHRPPQAGRRVEPLPARNARRSLRRRARREWPFHRTEAGRHAGTEEEDDAAGRPARSPAILDHHASPASPGSGRAGRHRSGTRRSRGPAATGTRNWSSMAMPRPCSARRRALQLPLALHRAGESPDVAAQPAKSSTSRIRWPHAFGTPNPQMPRPWSRPCSRQASACLAGELDGVVTGPVHKAAINAGGIAYTGTTGLLAEQAGCDVVMMLANPIVRVALVTTHLPLRAVADAITADGTAQRPGHRACAHCATTSASPSPRIAVLGLNPARRGSRPPGR